MSKLSKEDWRPSKTEILLKFSEKIYFIMIIKFSLQLTQKIKIVFLR